MRQLIKYFLVVGCLALGLQGAWAYSLIGPSGSYTGVPTGFGDAWEQEVIGFNPIPAYTGAPPYLGVDNLATGPKNIGEGYRRNTPVIYYAFDGTEGSFAKFFGANGEQAVVQAFDILNALTNVDSYSSNLAEFPLQAQSQNYQATTVRLRDLKSTTLALMMEQMGLADAIRYVWILHNRFHEPGTPACPLNMDYLVTMRNYPVSASPLNQLQYSDYVNGELYTYYIPIDLCDQAPAPPDADAIELPSDPLTQTAPVASGNQMAEGALRSGYFYTGLTRDDVAGLRALYSSNNVNLESIVPGSTLVSGSSGGFTNLNDQYYLTTSNLTALLLAAKTNNPAALQTLYPGLVISGVVTNTFSGTYIYTFGNIYTNHAYSPTPFLFQVISTNIGPMIGAPYGTIVTNVTTNTTIIQSNIVSGDYFLIPTNTCGLDILGVVATNVVGITNTLGSFTNITVNSTNYITTNYVVVSTNYTLLVAPCEFPSGNTTLTPTNGYFEGVERIQFVRVPDDNVDPLTGNFIQPVTNQYTEVAVPPGGSPTVQTYQRVLTRPDILFAAADLLPGPSAVNTLVEAYYRTINFNLSNIPAPPPGAPNGLAGPGTIESPTTITFNKVGPILQNLSPTSLTEATAGLDGFIWGSFDGSTNDPIVYPNGTSIATLAAEALIQVFPLPPTLLNGTVGSAYSVTMTASGGHAPYTWALASGSAGLPPGLSLSANGVISGTPTQSGTFINIVIEVTDANNLVVDTTYSLTINSN